MSIKTKQPKTASLRLIRNVFGKVFAELATMNTEVQVEEIGRRIYFIRGNRVMLDSDLAELYHVETKNLNKAVSRNPNRFPCDFMFQLTQEEYESLRFQIGTLEKGRGKHRKYLPFVFTEQGVAMLSGILQSERAVHVNVAIMRTFVMLRKTLETNKELAKKLQQIERKLVLHDEDLKSVFEAIRRLMATGSPVTQRKIVPPGRE